MHHLCMLLFSWLCGNWDDSYQQSVRNMEEMAEWVKEDGEGGVIVERVEEIEEMPLKWTDL